MLNQYTSYAVLINVMFIYAMVLMEEQEEREKEKKNQKKQEGDEL